MKVLEQMSPTYKVCVVNLHLHYVDELIELEHDMEHDYAEKQEILQTNN